MINSDTLKTLYQSLCCMKIDLFCVCDCNSSESDIINKFIFELSDDIYCKDECCKENCKSLINLIIKILHCIEDDTNCKKDYAYLLQIERFSCFLSNLDRLLCQLKCLHVNDCKLIPKVLCVLYEIIELIQKIISKINNIECLCDSHLCCSCDTIDCLVCSMVEDISSLEDNISILAHLVLELASLNVINCTTCYSSHYSKPNRRECLSKQCDSSYFKPDCFNYKDVK